MTEPDELLQLTTEIRALFPDLHLDLVTVARAEVALDWARKAHARDDDLIAIREDDGEAALRFTYGDEVAGSIYRIHTAEYGIELPDAMIRDQWARVVASFAAIGVKPPAEWVAEQVAVWIAEREARIDRTIAQVAADRRIPVPPHVIEDAQREIRGLDHA
ncbi:hypothetical protein GCM10022288_11610 [Gryllotalpicola kribbensis]|uniref:Uncharacterized protein n=1 Tax=Gryllotalpicola kribbensis TaxID=993084 RepID=A0ABP8ANY2_9MICO